ncbi:MAG: Panacea domain-containing protein [Fimbriiglobus sp.]
MSPPYESVAVANQFIELASLEGKKLTPMQLIKLVYIAHGWHLAVNDVPLIDEPIEAWQYGPVIPSLFHEFKRYGRKPITKLAHSVSGDWDGDDFLVESPFVPEDDERTTKLIRHVWRKYGSKSGLELSELTHAEGTPWTKTIQPQLNTTDTFPKGMKIEEELIRDHYLDLWERNKTHG